MPKCENISDLQKLLMSLGATKEFVDHVNICQAAEKVALDLWLNRVDENEETKELRRQLLHLHRTGVWPGQG
jgi:hypothetical protein